MSSNLLCAMLMKKKQKKFLGVPTLLGSHDFASGVFFYFLEYDGEERQEMISEDPISHR